VRASFCRRAIDPSQSPYLPKWGLYGFSHLIRTDREAAFDDFLTASVVVQNFDQLTLAKPFPRGNLT
jgi:hypothetical protein